MAVKALAVKYRPKDWDDVTEQKSIKIILTQQLQAKEIKNAYLFTGPAGCGKTTCARIFANKINEGQGNPIEMDAASNSGVDDVKEICRQAQSKSLDSEYKVFIIDECHSISNTGWQAFLKLIEEPPAKSIFIFCTTDPQKIPKTILSRVQRYDFQRISQQGIENRLMRILTAEVDIVSVVEANQAIEYIAKLADGGMRDAITLLDKCLSFSSQLTIENVVSSLGVTDYDTMFELTDCIVSSNVKEAVEVIERVHCAGKDLKLFLKQYIQFLLDALKLDIGCSWQYVMIPELPEYKDRLKRYQGDDLHSILSYMVNTNSDIKFSPSPKYDIEVALFELWREFDCGGILR